MKNILSLTALFLAFMLNAQSPFLNGIKVINPLEKQMDTIDRIPVIYSNGQIKDYFKKDSLKNWILEDVPNSEIILDSIYANSFWINVVDYGADSTGAVSSHLAFREINDSAVAQQKIIYVPSGHYIFDNDIELSGGVKFVFAPNVTLSLSDDFVGDNSVVIAAKFRNSLFWSESDNISFDFSNTIFNGNQDNLELAPDIATQSYSNFFITETSKEITSVGTIIFEKTHNGFMLWGGNRLEVDDSYYHNIESVLYRNPPVTTDKQNAPIDIRGISDLFFGSIETNGAEEAIDFNRYVARVNIGSINAVDNTQSAIEVNNSKLVVVNSLQAKNIPNPIHLFSYADDQRTYNDGIVINNAIITMDEGAKLNQVVRINGTRNVRIDNLVYIQKGELSAEGANELMVFQTNSKNIDITASFLSNDTIPATGLSDKMIKINSVNGINLKLNSNINVPVGEDFINVSNGSSDNISIKLNAISSTAGNLVKVDDTNAFVVIETGNVRGFADLVVNTNTNVFPYATFSTLPTAMKTGQIALQTSNGRYYYYSSGWKLFSYGTGINDLTDTPANFTGAGGLFLAVNSGATAVEYKPIEPPNIGLTTGAGRIPYRVNATTFGSYEVDQAAAGNNTIARRTASGETFTNTATDNGHAVNLGQMNTALALKPNIAGSNIITGNWTFNNPINIANATLSGQGINLGQGNSLYVALTGNQTIADTKTYSTSPVVPSKSTAAGNNPTTIATEAQVFLKANLASPTFTGDVIIPAGNAPTEAIQVQQVEEMIAEKEWVATFTGDVTFAVSGSQVLNSNLSDVPDATEWNNAGNWEITWKDSGFFYKLTSMEDVLEVIPSYGSGNLSLSLVVTSSVTIPTGAKIRFVNY